LTPVDVDLPLAQLRLDDVPGLAGLDDDVAAAHELAQGTEPEAVASPGLHIFRNPCLELGGDVLVEGHHGHLEVFPQVLGGADDGHGLAATGTGVDDEAVVGLGDGLEDGRLVGGRFEFLCHCYTLLSGRSSYFIGLFKKIKLFFWPLLTWRPLQAARGFHACHGDLQAGLL